jgi:hypothetical protein
MAGSPQERVLAAELLVVMGVETADALSGAYTGSFSLPSPSRYFATVVVYLMLAGMAMFGEKPARLATSFGGVAALAILIAPTKASVAANKPQAVVVSALNYFAQMISAGSFASVAQNSGSTSAANQLATTGITVLPLSAKQAEAPNPNTDLSQLGTGVTPSGLIPG